MSSDVIPNNAFIERLESAISIGKCLPYLPGDGPKPDGHENCDAVIGDFVIYELKGRTTLLNPLEQMAKPMYGKWQFKVGSLI